jgi:hypothetical protein
MRRAHDFDKASGAPIATMTSAAMLRGRRRL